MSTINYRLVLDCGHGVSVGRRRWAEARQMDECDCRFCNKVGLIVEKTSHTRGSDPS